MRIVILTNLSSIFGNLGDIFQSSGVENIPQVPGNRDKVGQNLYARRAHISAQKRQSERSKSFAVSISLQTKAVRN